MEKKIQIALVPSPGISHLIPFVEFAKRLVHLHHDFQVTFIVPALETHLKATQNILSSLPSTMDSVVILAHPQDLPQSAWPAIKIVQAVTASLPSVRDALRSMAAKSQRIILMMDLFSLDVLDVAKEFHIPPYLFVTTGATALSLFFYARTLHETIAGDLIAVKERIRIPGCVPLHVADFPEPVLDKSTEAYWQYLHILQRIHQTDGILVNTFLDIEEGPVKALNSEADAGHVPPIYPIGPIIQTAGSSIRQDHGLEILSWLDSQPHNSVLYVSFGTGGTLSHDQLIELARGLELSGKKFIWVLRPPSQAPHGAFIGAQNENPFSFLTRGFLERTKEQGIVIPSWAPQIEVLSHESTAGFLSHCGWSSTLESIVHGVPIIAWPLFAEQKMNAAFLTDGIKVALRPKLNEKGIVESGEIVQVIMSLMEGEEGKGIRERMSLLKVAAFNALREDGTSTSALSELALKWTKSGLIDLQV